MRAPSVITAAVAAVAAVAAAATAAVPAGSTGSAVVLAALNAERAANGIPAPVTENAAWSAKCASHVAYMAAAGGLTHAEDPGSTRYTEGGTWAGEHAVVALSRPAIAGDPFADAPLHLIQLLAPALQEVGIAVDASGYLCITTWPGYRKSGWTKPAVYTYPGDGATGVPPAERAEELPFVPGDFVGLPLGTTTGFNIMVFAEGIRSPWTAHIVSATLEGPDGRSVAVKTVDRTTPTVGVYLPPGGGFVIPVAPLRPGTTYTATVRFKGGVSHTWRFTTAAA